MKKRTNLLPVIVILSALCNWRPVPGMVAAVVPVDPGQELYQSIRKQKKDARVLPAQKTIAAVNDHDPVLIEVHKKARANKVFSAAQFVCGLPIETGTIKTVCKEPKDVEEALKKMKEEGFDEIWLKTPASGDVYNALVKSARELEIRINA
jgi:hypothetical protein